MQDDNGKCTTNLCWLDTDASGVRRFYRGLEYPNPKIFLWPAGQSLHSSNGPPRKGLDGLPMFVLGQLKSRIKDSDSVPLWLFFEFFLNILCIDEALNVKECCHIAQYTFRSNAFKHRHVYGMMTDDHILNTLKMYCSWNNCLSIESSHKITWPGSWLINRKDSAFLQGNKSLDHLSFHRTQVKCCLKHASNVGAHNLHVNAGNTWSQRWTICWKRTVWKADKTLGGWSHILWTTCDRSTRAHLPLFAGKFPSEWTNPHHEHACKCMPLYWWKHYRKLRWVEEQCACPPFVWTTGFVKADTIAKGFKLSGLRKRHAVSVRLNNDQMYNPMIDGIGNACSRVDDRTF